MKVIDEKGRFLGKINLIDLIVLIGIILVAFILVGKLLGGKDAALGGQTKLTYTVKVYDVDPDVYESIKKVTFPDQLMAAGDMLNGKVISVSEEPSQGQVYEVVPNAQQGGMELHTGAKNTYDLTFTIEAYVANDVKNELGTQEIRVGKTHIVKTSQFELEDGVVLSCVREQAR
ncbi:MAG: hypothetical protein K0S60_661 [Evtepia sp.]|jgi:hypothetical protein|nr:hypothetical protein [Evtepia sp.]